MHHKTGTPREQVTLLPEAIEDYIAEDNPVRFIDAFVDKLDLQSLGFDKAQFAETGRPPYQPMAQRAKEALGVDTLTVVADKGYATGTEWHTCEQNGITVYVPLTQPTEQRRSNVPAPEYYHPEFRYDKERDCYICPLQHELHRQYMAWVQ